MSTEAPTSLFDQIIARRIQMSPYEDPSMTLARVQQTMTKFVSPNIDILLNSLRAGGPVTIYREQEGDPNLHPLQVTIKNFLSTEREKHKAQSRTTTYPSRPLLTSIGVRLLVGFPTIYEAAYHYNDYLKFMSLVDVGAAAIDAMWSIERAERAISEGARQDTLSLLRTLGVDPSEDDVEARVTRYQEWADRLIRGKTGIPSVESAVLMSIAAQVIVPMRGSAPRGPKDEITDFSIAGSIFALEAYKIVYEQANFPPKAP